MGKYVDRRGKRYGRLVAIKDVGRTTKQGDVIWLCKCDCGNLARVRGSSLTSGNTRSCGCLAEEGRNRFITAATKHGEYNTSLYRVWCSMKHRCLNKNDQSYHNYGGRGINVCDEWLNYEAFRDWAIANGYKKGLTLERINNDGNYEPSNCKWIPKAKQSNNTRRCIRLTYNGKTMNIKDWANTMGLPYNLLQKRIKRGWPVEKALTTKPGAKTGPKPKTTDERLCKVVGI